MKHLMLDTDVCIEIIRGRSEPIEAHIDASLCISSITRFELVTGIKKSKNPKLSARGNAFLKEATCIAFDDDAANAAAKVRAELEAKGEKIGAYDTLIAGHCLALKQTLLTGNLNEFSRVEGLKVLPWRASPASKPSV